jgi:PAS domain-containing protein
MKISDEDTDRVISTLQHHLQGLSISELARESGLNRNKISIIAENLSREGILTCSHLCKSKIYTLKNPSAIFAILEHIPDPSLIADENLHVIRVNPAFSTVFSIDEQQIRVQPVHAIPCISGSSIPGQLHTCLEEGKDGEKTIIRNESGTEICTSVRITLPGEKPALLIIFHPEGNNGEKRDRKDLIVRLLSTLSENLPGILQGRTLGEAFLTLSGLIRNTVPDRLILTMLVDEPGKTGTLHSLRVPGSSRRQNREDTGPMPGEPFPVPIPELIVLQYKNGRILPEDTLPGLLLSRDLPEELKKTTTSLSRFAIPSIGILWNKTLIGIVGIGSPRETAIPGENHEILSLVSGFYISAALSCMRSKETDQIREEFHAKYRDIYTLLAKKTEEEMLHAARSGQFSMVAAAVADYLNAAFLVTNGDGTTLSANRTAMRLLQIREKDLLVPVLLQDLLPADLAELKSTLIPHRDAPQQGSHPNVTTAIMQGMEMTWYLAGNPAGTASDLHVIIGEKSPAPLVQYLLAHFG